MPDPGLYCVQSDVRAGRIQPLHSATDQEGNALAPLQ